MTPFQQKQLDLMRQMEAALAHNTQASTIVPFQRDYPNDTQLWLSVNTFLPGNITHTIQAQLIQPLRALDLSQYYYPSEALHITLHSIRIIHDPPTYTETHIASSKQLLTRIIPSQQSFPFVLRGVLSLPTSLAIIALITPEYDRFIRSLRTAFVQTGIPDDKKYFTNEIVFANCTVCRYTHKPSVQFLKKLTELKDIYIGEFVATDASLVETNAGAHPSKTKVFGTYRFAVT